MSQESVLDALSKNSNPDKNNKEALKQFIDSAKGSAKNKEESSEGDVSLKEYVIQPTDVGRELNDIIEKAKSLNPEQPSEEEKEMLDSLLLKGYAEKSYPLSSDFSVVFRTISGIGVENGWSILVQDDQPKAQIIQQNNIKIMQIAKYLKQYGNNSFDNDGEDFESRESIAKRYAFVKSLPAIVIDALANFQSVFLEEVERALRVKKIENF